MLSRLASQWLSWTIRLPTLQHLYNTTPGSWHWSDATPYHSTAPGSCLLDCSWSTPTFGLHWSEHAVSHANHWPLFRVRTCQLIPCWVHLLTWTWLSAHQSPSSTLPCSSALTHRTWTSKDGSAGTFRNGAVMADVTDFASNTACSWMSVDLEPSISCLATWSVRGPCFSSWSTNLVSRPASIASVAANSSLENVDLVSVPLRRISRGAFLLRPAMPPSGVHSSLKRPTVSLATDLSTMPCITWVCAA